MLFSLLKKKLFTLLVFLFISLVCSNYLGCLYFYFFKLDEFRLIETEMDFFYFKETIRFCSGPYFSDSLFNIFNSDSFFIRIIYLSNDVVSITILPKDLTLLNKNYFFFYGSCYIHMYYFTNIEVYTSLCQHFDLVLNALGYDFATSHYSLQKVLDPYYFYVQCFNVRHYIWNIFCKYILIYHTNLDHVVFSMKMDHLFFFIRTSFYHYSVRFLLRFIKMDFFFHSIMKKKIAK